MTLSLSLLAATALLCLMVLAAPVWPWSRGLSPRPMLVAGLCLVLYALAAVWLVPG